MVPALPTSIAVAVVECDDQFLVGLRPEGVPLAGYWEFPGGKVREGETPADAAARECREETGIRVTMSRLLLRTVHDYEHGVLELHFFAAVLSDPQPAPRPPFRWVVRQDLPTLRFPPANSGLLVMLGASGDGSEKDC
jgi:8-oxo-dGTP diphosphatase